MDARGQGMGVRGQGMGLGAGNGCRGQLSLLERGAGVPRDTTAVLCALRLSARSAEPLSVTAPLTAPTLRDTRAHGDLGSDTRHLLAAWNNAQGQPRESNPCPVYKVRQSSLEHLAD